MISDCVCTQVRCDHASTAARPWLIVATMTGHEWHAQCVHAPHEGGIHHEHTCVQSVLSSAHRVSVQRKHYLLTQVRYVWTGIPIVHNCRLRLAGIEFFRCRGSHAGGVTLFHWPLVLSGNSTLLFRPSDWKPCGDSQERRFLLSRAQIKGT